MQIPTNCNINLIPQILMKDNRKSQKKKLRAVSSVQEGSSD